MSDLQKCFLTDHYPSSGLRVGAVHVAIGNEPDGGWPSITVVDAFGNEAHYSLGISNQERGGHKKEVARLKELARRAEKQRDDANENLGATQFAVAIERKKTAAEIERNKTLMADAEKLLKKAAEAKTEASSWRAKSNNRDKKIAELRDMLAQERARPLFDIARQRLATRLQSLKAKLRWTK